MSTRTIEQVVQPWDQLEPTASRLDGEEGEKRMIREEEREKGSEEEGGK